MRIKFICIVVAAWSLISVGIQTGDPGLWAARGEFAIPKNAAAYQETGSVEAGSASVPGSQYPKSHPFEATSRTAFRKDNEKRAYPAAPMPNDTGDRGTIDLAESQSAGKSAAAPSGQRNTSLPGINWSSRSQKQRCEKYLVEIRMLFIKTRHYSNQRASCDLAANAAAFLQSVAVCQQNCPPGFLERSGYNQRILRNIRYLEQLSKERCSSSITPVPPVTKTP